MMSTRPASADAGRDHLHHYLHLWEFLARMQQYLLIVCRGQSTDRKAAIAFHRSMLAAVRTVTQRHGVSTFARSFLLFSTCLHHYPLWPLWPLWA
jgi:hypothetical protein